MIGWIKLYRQIWDNPRSSDPAWLSVWVYLLTHATREPKEAKWAGGVIMLNPGQLITGRIQIAKYTGVHESKIFRVLKCLKSEQQIEQQTSNASSLISILNWKEYQGGEQQDEQQMNSQRTTDEQRMNTNKEDKKIRSKEKRNNTLPPTPKIAEASSAETQKKIDQTAKRLAKKVREKKEPEPLHMDCKNDYLRIYPEHFWEGKDGKALNTLLQKIRHSFKSSEKNPHTPTGDETKAVYLRIIQAPNEWMRTNGKTGMVDFNSQYDSIVTKIKNEQSGNTKNGRKSHSEQHAELDKAAAGFAATLRE